MTLLIRYAIVAKILKLHRITFFTVQTLNTVRFIIQVYLFLLYGKENLDNINNTSILNATIKHLTETKRFDAKLF